MILDDALSAVDTDTEASILANLRQQRQNKTTIIVAHRLSTIMQADRIFVLEDGKLSQAGNHESLSQSKGIYQDLCALQGQVQQEILNHRDTKELPV